MDGGTFVLAAKFEYFVDFSVRYFILHQMETHFTEANISSMLNKNAAYMCLQPPISISTIIVPKPNDINSLLLILISIYK